MLPTECIECILQMCVPLQRFIIATDFRYLFLQKRIVPRVTKFHDLCARGLVDALEYAWTVSDMNEYVDPNEIEICMSSASLHGHVAVLEWLKNSGISLPVTNWPMDHATENGHIHVLNWWKDSGLELSWSYRSIDIARLRNQTAVLEWWKTSGLELKYPFARYCINRCYVEVTWHEYLNSDHCPQCRSPYPHGDTWNLFSTSGGLQ